MPSIGGTVYERVAALAAHLRETKPLSVALGLGVAAVTLGCEKWNPRVPGALIGLVAATTAVAAFGLEKYGISVLGDVPAGLPRFSLASVDHAQVYALIPLAIVISLVVMMQTAATTRSFPVAGEPQDVDRDFIGVGVGSVLAGLFGAFPVNTSPPRTAIVAEVGARSQLAGLLAVAIILALAGFGTGLLAHVPEAALAGMLLFVAQRIFRLQTFVEIYRRAPGEFALVLATMTAIVLLPIQTGVVVGIFLSLLHGVFIITRAVPVELERVPGTTIWWPPHAPVRGEKEAGVLVMAFQAPLSFLNAYDFRRGIMDAVARHGGRYPPGRAGGGQHRGDRLHGRRRALRGDPQMPRRRRRFRGGAARNRSAPRRRSRASGWWSCSARITSSTASRRRSGRSAGSSRTGSAGLR